MVCTEKFDRFVVFFIFSFVLALLFLFNNSFAAIYVETPLVSSSTVNPGDSFTVKANVTEINGISFIYNTNVTCVGSGGTEGTDNWDSYTKLNASVGWTVINTTTIEVNATITLNTSSINGTWTCKVYGNNTSSESAFESVNQPSVNTRVGIIISQSSCTFAGGNPGSNNNAWSCGGSAYNRYTHDGNTGMNITINGTDLIGVTDNSWVIAAGNVTYKNVTSEAGAPSLPGIALTTTETDLQPIWGRGTYPTKNANDLYCWLNYPTPLKYQTYGGTLTLTVKQAN